MPPALAQGAPCYADVHDVRDEERGEEGADYLLLQHGMREEVFACRSEDEEVDEAEEAYDVSELQHGDLRRAG